MHLAFSVALSFAASALGQYDQWYFSSNASNWKCDGIPWGCPPPSVCTRDRLTDRSYCCGPDADAVCWSNAPGCTGGSQTAGSGQLDCGSYCCLSGRQQCTQRANQVNVCWATVNNPIANLSQNALNATYSSLAAASPSATALSVSLAQLVPTSTSVPTSSASSTNAPTSSPAGSDQPVNPSQISGGAIAGIVIGGLVALGLVVAGIVILFLRKRHAYAHPGDAASGVPGAQIYTPGMQQGPQGGYNSSITGYYADTKYAPVSTMQHDAEPTELYGGPMAPTELPSKPS